jgi:hypothetical protein
MIVEFDTLEVGEVFYDDFTNSEFQKVCGNAAVLLQHGKVESGSLFTFDLNDEVEVSG